ncbi:MAG: hypothetical protein QMC96_06895 [Methanomicrobiales archaeon]|nr:hypothetical protein [Methanomicrobiales archaeon]
MDIAELGCTAVPPSFGNDGTAAIGIAEDRITPTTANDTRSNPALVSVSREMRDLRIDTSGIVRLIGCARGTGSPHSRRSSLGRKMASRIFYPLDGIPL